MVKVRRVDSHLGDINWKGKLTIVYPSKDEDVQVKTIPFFENPEITEAQTPRYANYAVVGRSSNLFGYLGTDSRKFNVTFKLTLPHIMNAPQQDFDKLFSSASTKIQKRREILQAGSKFSKGVGNTLMNLGGKNAFTGWGGLTKETAQARRQWGTGTIAGSKLKDEWGGAAHAAANRADAEDRHLAQKQQAWAGGIAQKYDESYYDQILSEEEISLNKALSVTSPLYDGNSEGSKLRSTVINNAEDTQFGPPIVRLDFGMLYNDVPCVCKGYNITITDKGGYDKKTLLPRSFTIRLALEEARNLASALSPTPVKDGLVGWEVLLGSDVIPGTTMDPGNFDISEWFNEPITNSDGENQSFFNS